jgi:general secretion pathway protein G
MKILEKLKMKTRTKQNRRNAFTLVELMIVVVIIGILAATILPSVIGHKVEAQIGAAKADVSELESAVERFYVNMDRYPSTEEGLKVLVDPPTTEDAKNWRGPYIKILRNDPWGTPIQYRYPGTHHPTSFDVWSRGADHQDGGEGDAADIGNWENGK